MSKKLEIQKRLKERCQKFIDRREPLKSEIKELDEKIRRLSILIENLNR